MNWKEFKTIEAYAKALKHAEEEERMKKLERENMRRLVESSKVKSVFRRKFMEVYDRVTEPELDIDEVELKLYMAGKLVFSCAYSVDPVEFKKTDGSEINHDFIVEQILKNI